MACRGEASDYKLDDQYRLSELNYSKDGKHWKVVYSAYDSKIQPAMPANMELSDGDQRIKLKMDNWIVK
ncbi:outer membrane lipoprotein LolB [Citrobacter freundii]|nr:outer membrane lipoprotein LolB [Citrobacter freundii]